MSLWSSLYLEKLHIITFFTKYCSFPYTIQNLKKKILIDAHDKILVRNYWYSDLCPKLLKFLQGVLHVIPEF